MPNSCAKSKNCGKSRVGKNYYDKDSVELTALGDLDELNSLLGLVKRQGFPKSFESKIEFIQKDLFSIQANIALAIFSLRTDIPKFSKKRVFALEKEINLLKKDLNLTGKFVIPGASKKSSWLDFARAVSRRAERSSVSLSRKVQVSENILSYLNSLSSFLFAAARYYSQKDGIEERGVFYQ